MFKGRYKYILLLFFFILSNFYTFSSNASCIAKDHVTGYTETFFASLPDNVVGIISDQIFGRMKGSSATNIFSNNKLDFTDRYWDQGMVYKIFMGIVGNARFQTVFFLCVILLVAFLGVSFTFGMTNISTATLLKYLFKIAVVVFFTTPSGWDTYLELIVKNVVGASRYFNRAIIASMYGINVEDVGSPFSPINLVITAFFHKDTWNKIIALFWAHGFAFTVVLIIVILYSIVTSLIILAKATILYATTILMSSLLLALGPIFAICILFERTQPFFSKWLTNLIGIFMQQYILFLGFFIFCVVLAGMIRGFFYFESCWDTVLALRFKVKMPKFIKDVVGFLIKLIKKILPFIPMVNLPDYIINLTISILKSWSIALPVFDLPSNIFSAGSLFIVSMMFAKFIDSVSDIGGEIANSSLSATSMAPKSMMEQLGKFQAAATKGFAKAAFNVTKLPENVSRAAEKLGNVVDKKIAQREKDPTANKGLTNFLKGVSKSSHAAGFYGTHVIQPMSKVRKLRTMQKNQANAQKFQDKLLRKYVGKGKAYASQKDLPQSLKDEINKKTKDYLRENGHSGVFDKRGNEVKMTEEQIEETFKTTVTKFGVEVGQPDIDMNRETVESSNAAIALLKGAGKGIFMRTDIRNRIPDTLKPAIKGAARKLSKTAITRHIITEKFVNNMNNELEGY